MSMDAKSDPTLAFTVNRDGAVNVAEAARDANSRLLFLSSDYVFDGKKTSPYETEDARNPQSVYGRFEGRSRGAAAGNPSRLLHCENFLAVWDGWEVFSRYDSSTCKQPAIDRCGQRSTRLSDICSRSGKSDHGPLPQDASGIVHVTNEGDCTWFEFAQEIVKRSGLATEVRPVTSVQMARPAPRPAYSVLSAKSLQKYGIETPSWREALVDI